jgi:hypothetical protein
MYIQQQVRRLANSDLQISTMNDYLFLKKEEINNFDMIMDIIFNAGLSKDVLAVEHIGDIIFFLDKRDKVRDQNDPELKKAVFTVIKAMIDSGQVELRWQYTWVKSARDSPPKNDKEIFDFLDEYLNKDDGLGLDKNYLLFFRKLKK